MNVWLFALELTVPIVILAGVLYLTWMADGLWGGAKLFDRLRRGHPSRVAMGSARNGKKGGCPGAAPCSSAPSAT